MDCIHFIINIRNILIYLLFMCSLFIRTVTGVLISL